CARRNLEAATIFMALVIFCVDRTLAIRLRRSFKLAMGFGPYPLSLTESFAEFVENGLQLGFRLIGQLLFLANGLEHVRMIGPHFSQELRFKPRHVLHPDTVEIT